jgi:hypothetical protein
MTLKFSKKILIKIPPKKSHSLKRRVENFAASLHPHKIPKKKPAEKRRMINP